MPSLVPANSSRSAGGSYADQDMNFVAGRDGAPVVFRPVKGANVALSDLDVHGMSVEFRSLAIREWEAHETANRVTFRNISGQGFWITARRT